MQSDISCDVRDREADVSAEMGENLRQRRDVPACLRIQYLLLLLLVLSIIGSLGKIEPLSPEEFAESVSLSSSASYT
ncbi:hypothetical protein ACFX1Q_010574 [Malus domestica]